MYALLKYIFRTFLLLLEQSSTEVFDILLLKQELFFFHTLHVHNASASKPQNPIPGPEKSDQIGKAIFPLYSPVSAFQHIGEWLQVR